MSRYASYEETDPFVWYGLAIGAVVGSGSEQSGDDKGLGGAKTGRDEDKGAQGLFSAFGHQVWLYVGGIMGFGRNAGAYLTTGPMIGADMDWAVGGGVHLFKRVGLGVVIPLRQAWQAAHSNPTTHRYAEQAYNYLTTGADAVGQMALTASSAVGQGLESLVSNPASALAAGMMVGAVAIADPDAASNMGSRIKGAYRSAKRTIEEKMYGL